MTLNHLAIIPDGNRRWAKDRGLPTFEGHRRGFDTAVKIGRYVRNRGIHTFTIWAFSTENWKRTKDEVGYLMRLYAEMTDKYLKEAIEDKVKIIHLGRKDRMPPYLLKKINDAEKKTKHFTSNLLNIALDYGGHDEILRAIRKVQSSPASPSEAGQAKFKVQSLSEENFDQFLDTAGQPYPHLDLIIRTSGEMRTSGFMPWQSAYSELFFVKKHFPDMNEKDIDEAIEEFNERHRRFGE